MDIIVNNSSYGDTLLCCRACLSTDRRLFNIHDYNLVDALAHITGNPVIKDELPQNLCSFCASLLLKCQSFREMCFHSQQSLIKVLLNEKLDLNSIRKINRPLNQYIDLTLCELNTIEYVDGDDPTEDIKEEPEIKIVGIDGIVNKTDSKTEFETQKRFVNISVNKLKHIKNRVRKIGNAIKRKKENSSVNDDDDVSTETKIKMEVDIDYNECGVYNEEIKEETESDNDDIILSSLKIKTPMKRRQEKLKKTVSVKKKKIDTKTPGKSKNDINNKVREGRRAKRKMRSAENDYMPEFDFAKFESAHAVKIVTLTKEEQLEEIASRKKSRNYLESRFRCEDCGKGFNAGPAYNNHRMRHDPSEGEFACEICGIRYKHKYQWQKHQDVHRLKLICNECEYVSRDRCQAQRHHAMHAGKTYECQHCGKTFNKMTTYFTHVRVVHPALCAACDICGETFVGDNGLRVHKKRAHAEKQQQFKCTICSANFVSIEALNRHTDTAREHRELRPCEQCGENCASETELQEHINNRHPKEAHRCDECDMTFPEATAYDVHRRRKHLNQRPTASKEQLAHYQRKYQARRRAALLNAPGGPLPPPGQAVCEECGRVFKVTKHQKNSTLLRYHQRIHQGIKPFACTQCPKAFAYKTSLDGHMMSHTGERPFQCPECPLAFALKGHFKRHHKTAHQGIRDNLPCSICGRVLSTKSALSTHVNTVHHGQPWPKRDRSKRKTDKQTNV